MTPPARSNCPAADSPDVRVIRADAADLDALSQVIADAFHGLEPSRWLVTGAAARRLIFPGYFRLYLEHAMASGVVQTTPGRDAAALWIPAGEGAAAPPAGYAARLAAVTGPWLARFEAFDAALDRRHPDGNHHHLAILAVRPDRQRQGAGTALLRAHHETLDRAGVPAYLEASSSRTRQIYLGHGYADHGPPIRLPRGPVMYPMMRRPAAPK
jgi:GNAT superfamily N-acetyltransferase